MAKTRKKTDPRDLKIEELSAQVAHLSVKFEAFHENLTRIQDATGGIWKMRDGTLIMVRSMSDNHLENAKKLVQMNPQSTSRTAWVELFTKEIERRRKDREQAAIDADQAPKLFLNGKTHELVKADAEWRRREKQDLLNKLEALIYQFK